MSVRSALSSGGGKLAFCVLTAAICSLTSVSALILVCPDARADSPGAVLKKMVDTYTNASAFTATIIMKQKGKTNDGKTFSVTKTQTIKYKAPNLVNVVVTLSGEGAAVGKVSQGNQTVVADGKFLIAYSPSRNQYIKKPDMPKVSVLDVLDILRRIPTHDAPNVKLLPSDSVNGRPVYVIEISKMMPSNLTAEQKKRWQDAAAHVNPLRFYVDKQNSSLVRISESAANGTIDISIENQLFNSTIPASMFSYTPPAGAKEVQATAPTSLGGAPGALGQKPGAPVPQPHK